MNHKITAKYLRKKTKEINPENVTHKLKIAILGYRSTQFLTKFIRQAAQINGIEPEIYEADYDQVELEVRNPSSGLYEFAPNVVFIVQSYSKLRNQFYDLSSKNRPFFFETKLEEWASSCDIISQKTNANILITNLEEVSDGVFGNFSNKTRHSFHNQVRRINHGFMNLAESNPSVHILDLAAMALQSGLDNWLDQGLYINADIPYSTDAEAKIAWEFVQMAKVSLGKFKKCLILDLDHTLWGGVIGDDGMSGIQLGSLGIGKAYSDLQKWARQLKERGIILAICSKNEETIAKEPFLNHPEMILKLDDIAVFVANWSNKADNIRYIQEVLNIGFDSMVFLDDNPMERELVRTSLPEVFVPELPEDPAHYLPFLSSMNLFETMSFSGQDISRTKQYQEEAKRKSIQQNFTDMDEFLQSLEMKAKIQPFQEVNLPRIAQLTQRSNQFNLRTIRYSEAEISNIRESDQHLSLEVSLEDKFGKYGLISVLILEKRIDKTLFIDTWLMSCRVLKRGVEKAVLNQLVLEAKREGYQQIVGEYLPTKKNVIVANHYADLGFRENGVGEWVLDISGYEPKEHFIEIISSQSPAA